MTTFIIDADGCLCVEVVREGVTHHEVGKSIGSMSMDWHNFFSAQQLKRLQELGVY